MAVDDGGTPSLAFPSGAGTPCALLHPLCPLCGGPNACVPAACGTFDRPCWCESAVFDAALLARVPAAERGRACVCADCVAAAATGTA